MPSVKYSETVPHQYPKKNITSHFPPLVRKMASGRGIFREDTMPNFTTLRFSSRWHNTELRDCLKIGISSDAFN